jgi:hypothetical protein
MDFAEARTRWRFFYVKPIYGSKKNRLRLCAAEKSMRRGRGAGQNAKDSANAKSPHAWHGSFWDEALFNAYRVAKA